jgi:hypothetical protein
MFAFVRRYRPALFALSILYAQGELATVTGVVTDAASAVVPGVKVTVRNTDTDISRSITTNDDGYFTIPELPAGPYELIVAKAGFHTYRETGITLETGRIALPGGTPA